VAARSLCRDLHLFFYLRCALPVVFLFFFFESRFCVLSQFIALSVLPSRCVRRKCDFSLPPPSLLRPPGWRISIFSIFLFSVLMLIRVPCFPATIGASLILVFCLRRIVCVHLPRGSAQVISFFVLFHWVSRCCVSLLFSLSFLPFGFKVVSFCV
jgi:hypothetical protein